MGDPLWVEAAAGARCPGTDRDPDLDTPWTYRCSRPRSTRNRRPDAAIGASVTQAVRNHVRNHYGNQVRNHTGTRSLGRAGGEFAEVTPSNS